LQLVVRKDEKCVSIRWQRMLQNAEGKYFMVLVAAFRSCSTLLEELLEQQKCM